MHAIRPAILGDADAIHALSAVLGYVESPREQNLQRLQQLLASERDMKSGCANLTDSCWVGCMPLSLSDWLQPRSWKSEALWSAKLRVAGAWARY